MLVKIRRTKMKLYKTINVYIDDGIFTLLQPKFDWMSVEDAKTLDLDYYLNHGQRSISPLYEQLINQQANNVDFNALNKLVAAVQEAVEKNNIKDVQNIIEQINELQTYINELTLNLHTMP